MITPFLRTTPLALVAFVGCQFAPVASAQAPATEPEKVNMPNAIVGKMTIDFQTRKQLTDENTPQVGAADTYKIDLTVAGTTQFVGSIKRLPNLKKWLGYKTAQEGGLQYDIDVFVLNPAFAGKPEFDANNPKHRRSVGKMTGNIALDPTGKYDPAALRMAISQAGTASAFESKARGLYYGKGAEASKAHAKAFEFVRTIGTRVVKLKAEDPDPLRFEGLVIPAGPAAVYVEKTVNGNLVYDYETGNYFTSDLTFTPAAGSPDKVTGSIKWSEDPQREANGKGRYEFNLRWNEDRNKPKADETAAFGGASEEDAFFAVDNSVPCMSGVVQYVDTNFRNVKTGSGKMKSMPGDSAVTFALEAFQLTKGQIMDIHKLLLLIVGPFNDE
jgi:hypothetical protein